MFPYLPALGKASELAKRIEREFELEYPSIDLDLVVDPSINYYDPLVVAGMLKGTGSGPSGGDPFDLVEVDTVLLGTLVDLGVVAEWPYASNDFLRVGHEAARLDGRQYGVPHWLCGHFVVTEDASVAEARTLEQLVTALEAMKTTRPNLVGNLVGSWNTAAIYIDSWADSRGNPDPSQALQLPLSRNVVADLVAFAAQGKDGKSNPCIDGTFDDWQDPDVAAFRFGRGEADALFGYSERIHYAQSAGADPSKLHILSAPLGNGSDPLWFADIWVTPIYDEDMIPAIAQGARREAARRFVDYISSPSTYEWIHLNSEAVGGKSIPRYLIPATLSAFETTALANDPIMRQIRPLVDQGTFFPQCRLPGLRHAICAEVISAWDSAAK